jgi:pyruvate/2-oxoglutarate/acetoin dehydrogenase E1 component
MVTYKEYATHIMERISYVQGVRILGYNVKYGHKFNGTLVDCNPDSLIEMPVAENLLMGVGIGMALTGLRPIVCVERMDFLWACADAIVNHLDKAKKLGWPPLNMIIRTCVGSSSPLDPGCQHQGNYYDIFKILLKEVDVRKARTLRELKEAYAGILEHEGPVMVVEYRDAYDQPTLTTVPSKAL